MGGMAKNALKNAFASKISKNKQSNTTTDSNYQTRPLGHIEKRAASRSIIKYADDPISYVPARIKKSEKSASTLKGSELSGCTFINGLIIDTILTGCTIDGSKNKLINLDLDFANIEVSGTAIINQLQVSRVNSNMIPSITQTYDIGTNLLQWNYIYGKYLDASYGLYVGGTTNGFLIERPTDSGNTNMTNSIGNLVIDNTNATGATIIQLGTDTDATDFQVKNNSGTTLFEVNGAGEAILSGCTVIDDIKICNNQIGHATDDTDLMTLTSGVLTIAGNVVASGGSFIMTSDKRLKKQIKELEKEHPDEDLEERFNNLEPVKFKWRKQAQQHNTSKKEKYYYGLIAQNVLKEFPECTFEKPDGYLGIDYMGLTSVLILKMQKQNKLLKEKDSKIEHLENTVKKQEIILNNLINRMERLEDMNENDSQNSQHSNKYSSSWDKYENSILRNYKDKDRDNDGSNFGSSFGSYGTGSLSR